MTASSVIEPMTLLSEELEQAFLDLSRQMLQSFINIADADAVFGAEYGQFSPDLTNSRSGYLSRELVRSGAAQTSSASSPTENP